MTGLGWLVFGSIVGQLCQAGLCPRTAGPGWLVFWSIAGRLAQAGLCSVVLQDGWPRLIMFSSIAGWLACVQYHCRMDGLVWLLYSSFNGWVACT